MLPPRGTWRSVAFDVFVAGLVAAGTVLQAALAQDHIPPLWIGLVMSAALLIRRSRPVITMAVISTLAVVQLLVEAQPNPTLYDVAVVIAMYSVVKYGRTMRDAYIAGGVVAIGIGIETAKTPTRYWWLLLLWYIGVCGGIWLGGYTVRNRRRHILSLEERAATLEREREHLARIAVAEERAVIARELHDVVAHSLAVMIVQAAGGSYAFDHAPERSRAALNTIAATGRDALEDMRRLVTVLRGDVEREPEIWRRLGAAELELLLDGARTAGLCIHADIDLPADLPPAVDLTVYRVVQEALTNVLRHAGPDATVRLGLTHAHAVVFVAVGDDGGDGTAHRVVGPPGHGLVGMRERVEVHGGTLIAGPRPAGGWEIKAEIPCG